MANHQVDGSLSGGASFIARWRASLPGSAGSPNYDGPSVANIEDIAGMRARLTAISPTSYTAERLDAMTLNDMIYAVRVHDDAAGF